MQSKLPINNFLLLLASILVALAIFYHWKLAQNEKLNTRLQTEYQQALSDYQANNIYYDPKTTVQWFQNRLNPAGYFVANPDMIFEPSQLNDSSLRATRYAVSTLRNLNALKTINKKAIGEFIFQLYLPDMQQSIHNQELNIYSRGGPYAAFRTITDRPAGVRPTMDALITLDALSMLDGPRINLAHIENFILVHQNADGGFWDEHYPKLGRASSMKCTSFATRALDIIKRHNGAAFPESVATGVQQFVQSSLDKASGGYGKQPGKKATDSYNSFRAFISLWNAASGSKQKRQHATNQLMDISTLANHLIKTHYLSDIGAFSRRNSDNKPSIKATHLILWMMNTLGELDQLETKRISQYVMSQQTRPGQYGGDIYTTYSAIGLLQKIGVSDKPLPTPEKPEKITGIPDYLPAMFFLTALAALALGYLSKKHELETLNKALSIQANFDGLTGIYNRQKFETIAKLEIEISRRYKRPLSLILIDADNFKLVNDTHGHLAGDKLLREITDVITSKLRDADIFARWGGEEFIILAPETNIHGATELAEKLRRLIAVHDFTVDQHVSCSFGVSQLKKDNDFESLIHRADVALYAAKRKGKNKVEVG